MYNKNVTTSANFRTLPIFEAKIGRIYGCKFEGQYLENARGYGCEMFRSQSLSHRPLGTVKILGPRNRCWDRGGAKVVKFNENFKIVAKFLHP